MGRGMLLAVIIGCLCAPVLASQEAAPAVADWVVGARPFTLETSRGQNRDALEDLTTTIPSIILENLADAGIRVLSPEEILERQLVALYKERTALAASLAAAVAERDRQLFLSSGERAVRENIREKERGMQEIRRDLAGKDAEIAGLKERLAGRDFDGIDEERETVVLWKASSSVLFDAERVGQEDINGLLTGRITASGNYVSVRVSLSVYPGGSQAIEVRSAASLADVAVMAREIAAQLKPVLQNRPTVLVDFDISPAEAHGDARILVDGEVFYARRLADGALVLPAGRHRIEVEADGFQSRGFTGDFSGGGSFVARIDLERVEYRQVEVSAERSEGVEGGRVYIDGIPEGGFGAPVELRTGLAFGTVLPAPPPEAGGGAEEPQAASEPGSPYYFVAEVDPEPGLLQLNVRLKRDTQAISSRIEKRRRAMYNSYSALIVSLIPAFVSYGMYVNMNNGWALGHESEETVRMWKNIYTGSMVLSAGLGVNLAVQLGLFIGAADGVLPERARAE